jgi:hypothetical protein
MVYCHDDEEDLDVIGASAEYLKTGPSESRGVGESLLTVNLIFK